MSLNWREIDLALNELPLSGAHIQQIVQPDFRNVLFQVYQPGNPFWLLVCLETGRTRMHRWTGPVKKPKVRQRFAQMLHSRLRGGRITSAVHVNNDRIIRMEIERAGEHSSLWIRLWGGAANIIVTDQSGLIIDAFFRRPKRGEVSGGHFDVVAHSPSSSDGQAESRKAAYVSRFQPDGADATPTVNEQIETHYQELESSGEREALLNAARRILSLRLAKLEQQSVRAESRLGGSEPADRMQLYGDLIMANLYRIQQGDRWLEAEDYTDENNLLSIELNPALSPGANAEKCYERAKRSRRRQEALAEELDNLRQRSSDAQQRLLQIDDEDVAGLRSLVDQAAATATAKSEPGTPTPGLQFKSGSFVILIGRTARENDQLLRRHVRGNDTWLHTRDYPGGYVFVRAVKGKSIPLDVLLDAGNLAVHFSKARTNGRAELYYTQVKHLRRAKGGPTGLVLPTHEKNLSIVLDQLRLDRLLK